MNDELRMIETELKKRHKFPYKWGAKQNNISDRSTNFIYDLFYLDQVIDRLKQQFGYESNYGQIFNYALNRWYNFWSAVAIEKIFCSLSGVEPCLNQRDRLVDFSIHGISFDHKTSIFPRAYTHSFEYAKKNPADLIQWLYTNQSHEQRQHFRNRLFIVVQNWKLKAEITWLSGLINHYVQNFNESKLQRLQFLPDTTTISDIIWAIKE